MRRRVAALILLAGTTAAAAAAKIPSSELPGRERQRFLETPVDRFTQPQPKAKPLWNRDCREQDRRKAKRRGKRKDC